MNIFKKLLSANHIFANMITIVTVMVIGYFWISDQYKAFEINSLEFKENYIKHQKEIIKNEIKRSINFIEYEIKNNNIPNMKEHILERLERVRFGKDGYLFVYDFNGVNLMHPILPKLIGKNLIDLKDKNGVFIIKELIDVSKNRDGGFVEYIWNKPSINKDAQKLGYAMSISSFKWMIGTGVYVDEINTILLEKQKNLDKKIKSDIYQIIFILASIMLATIAFIELWNLKLRNSFREFTEFFQKASIENIHLSEEKVNFEEFKKLTHLANDMVTSRENIETQLKEQAYRDPLTQSYNRRYFYEVSSELLHLAQRDKTPLSIIMIDIDKFKNINDTYGHIIGDEVIILVAKTLEYLVRKSDIVARFGGEEFTIILPKSDITQTRLIAEKIRSTIEDEILKINKHKIKFTISLGISEFDYVNNKTLENILDSADKALYNAKENGRNQIC